MQFNLENHPESFRRFLSENEDDINSHSFSFPQFLGSIAKPIKKYNAYFFSTKKKCKQKQTIIFFL